MREIKFRAWDKELAEMNRVTSIHFIDEFNKNKGYEDVVYVEGQIDATPLSKIELMQDTGLKDKNGKEIYEGDIIKNNFAETIGSIMFADCGYWIKTINKDIFDNTIYHVLGQYDGEVLEIIGNIYENPELLEGVDND